MLDEMNNRIKTLKKVVRKEQAWIRLFEEYGTGEELTDLLMVNRPLTRHEKKLLLAIPSLRWYSSDDHLEFRNIVLIRKAISHSLKEQLLAHGINSNNSLVNHISLIDDTGISILNRWYEIINADQFSISMIATVDVPKRYYLSRFQPREIVLPSRCSNIPVNSTLSYATVIINITGIADLSKKYIYYNGHIISEQEGYKEFIESYRDKPWYRKIGAFAPTPFNEWIKDQAYVKPPYLDPELFINSGIVTKEFLSNQADLLAQEVSREFNTLWTEILGHPHVHFRKSIMHIKKH